MQQHTNKTVFLSFITGFLFLCTNPERDNPFDINSPNFHAPAISSCTSPTSFVSRQDQPISLTINATDPNGTIMMYYWGTAPEDWIDSSTSPTLTIPYISGGGTRIIHVGVRNNDGVPATGTVTALFNRRPASASMTAPAPGTAATWHAFDFQAGTGSVVCNVSATDPDNNLRDSSYSLVVSNGAATVTANGGSPLTVSGLKPSSACHWTLTARDIPGDSCVATGTFTTPAAPAAPALTISASTLTFGTITTTRTFTVSNTGSASLTWSLTDDATWLTVSPSSGTLAAGSSATLTASVARTGMVSGDYTATVTITPSYGTAQTIGVSMSVAIPSLAVSRTSMAFGSSTTSLTFTVSNTGGGSFTWSASDNAPWLTLSPTSGSISTASTTITATVSRTGLAVGSYSGTVTITTPNAGNATISVTMEVAQSGTVIRIINQLIDSVNVWANGSLLGKVRAEDSVSYTRYGLDTLRVNFTLIRRRTSGGTPMGEEMAGVWNTITNPGALHRYVVNNIIGTSTYFAPVITNTSTSNIEPIVNQVNLYSLSCNCAVPYGWSNIAIGYYRFFSTTDVRAYRPGTSYTGAYVYWDNSQLASLMVEGSGQVSLTCNSVSW